MLAWRALRESGVVVYCPNPDLNQAKNQYGMGYIRYTSGCEPDFHELWSRSYIFGGFNPPALYAFYNFEFASKADSKLAFEKMPEIDDRRVGYYFYNGSRNRRPEFRSNYNDMIRRVKYPILRRNYVVQETPRSITD